MKTQLKTVAYMAVAAAITVGLTACNTMQGVGQDISAGGKALSKVAKHTENGNSKQHKKH